jgi:hypothetical protein
MAITAAAIIPYCRAASTYADCVIGASCPRVPGREGYLVLFGGKCHQRVIDGTACDAEAAQRVRELPAPRVAQEQRRREAGSGGERAAP